MTDRPASSSTARVQAHRAAMQAKGWRLMQRWVPDPASAAIQESFAREAAALAAMPEETEAMAWIDHVSDPDTLAER
jgi:hypothetical protein